MVHISVHIEHGGAEETVRDSNKKIQIKIIVNINVNMAILGIPVIPDIDLQLLKIIMQFTGIEYN